MRPLVPALACLLAIPAFALPYPPTVEAAPCHVRDHRRCPPPPDAQPVADFTIVPNPAVRTRPTAFTSTSTCQDAPCSYAWFHGDGPPDDQIGSGISASFTYVGPPGTRTVTLRVTDADRDVDMETKSFQLIEPNAPNPACSDGQDNDGDGATDYPVDPGCSGATDNDESNVVIPPPSTGFPNASNTGPSGTLAPSGGFTVNTAGVVVQNLDITGHVQINASNVTVRNVRVRNSGNPIDTARGVTNVRVEDSELDGGMTNGTCLGIQDGSVVRRTELRGCENGLNVSGSGTVEDNWIHDLTTCCGAHTDGIQTPASATDFVIRHNTVDPVAGTSGGTSAIIMWNGEDPQNSNARIENNLLLGEGSSYTLYCPRQPAGGIYINNNRFQRGVFGYTDSCHVGTTITEFNGNVDHFTGQPL
jgi:hypothetical protein